MRNFLASCLAVGILGSGFALTGDLGWLVARATRVLQASDVPDDDGPIPVGDPACRAPVTALRARRGGGPDRVDLAALRPGDRVFVWLGGDPEPLPVDVVDPVSAAVILRRGTPQRAAVAGGAIVRGAPLRVVPFGLAHAGASVPAEAVGEITGIRLGP